MGYTIDAAATIRSLEAAGIQPKQARAIVNAISRSDETLATKSDLMALEARITMRLYTCAIGIVGLLLAAQLFASGFLG